MKDEFVSILMLTHNAPNYVETAIRSLREKTVGVTYELVVVDNASDRPTIDLLEKLVAEKYIDRIIFSKINTLFAGGNNIAAAEVDSRSTHFLLLNSDIEVRSHNWLRHLLDLHQSPGITSYGIVESQPMRVDGYCMLIDATLYAERGGLDEGHQWWWAVTKLQAQILSDGCVVQGYYEHDKWLIHFGGRSGDGFKNAKGMNVSREEVSSWFCGKEPVVLDQKKMLRHRYIKKLMKPFATITSAMRRVF